MISLFVRSYHKDFKWLSYSVKSMRKNLEGISDKVLCVPYDTQIPNDISTFFDKIIYNHETHPGYVAQQIDKVRAYLYCQFEDILFSDSDCIYFQKFDATRMLEGNKIILPVTKYTTLHEDKNVMRWQKITRLSTGILPEHEYMRCFPILHKSKVCKHLDNLPEYNQHLQVIQSNELSEFNALGIIARLYYPNDYIFVDTETTMPTMTAKQYWSWGGITPEIWKELQTI